MRFFLIIASAVLAPLFVIFGQGLPIGEPTEAEEYKSPNYYGPYKPAMKTTPPSPPPASSDEGENEIDSGSQENESSGADGLDADSSESDEAAGQFEPDEDNSSGSEEAGFDGEQFDSFEAAEGDEPAQNSPGMEANQNSDSTDGPAGVDEAENDQFSEADGSQPNESSPSVEQSANLEPVKGTVPGEGSQNTAKKKKPLNQLVSGQPVIGDKYQEYAGKFWITSKTKIALSVTDDFGPAQIKYAINNGAFQIYKVPLEFDQEGNYSVTYFGQDVALNEETPKKKNIGVDNTPPKVSFAFNPAVEWIGSVPFLPKGAGITMGITDKGIGAGRIFFKLNGNQFAEYTSTVALESGWNNVRYYTEDLLGNKSATYTLKVYLDAIPPQTKLQLPPGTPKVGELFVLKPQDQLTFEAIDKQSGPSFVEYRAQGAAQWAKLPSKASVDAKSFGYDQEVELYYRSVDFMGNVSTAQNIRFRIDGKAPTTVISVQ